MATSSPSSPGTGSSIPQLFSDVQRAVREEEDYVKALRLIAKILAADAGNQKALHCKVVCLIRSGEFADALDTITKHMEPGTQAGVAFEHAYCLYRLNRVQEALDMLTGLKSSDQRVKELMAQSLYRLERFEDSFRLYVDLMKNSTDECEDERETNLSAVMASISLTGGSVAGKPEIGEQIYELCYNKSCISIGQSEFEKAKELLVKARTLCEKTMREEDQTEEEIVSETGIMNAQLGFVQQLLGRSQDALSLYNQVLKSKPSDPALLAVVSNNVVALNKDQNVFDSKKKMRSALSEEAKLNALQKRTIAVNHCLFLLTTGQTETCDQQLQALKKKYPNDGDADLVHAALLVRDKKWDEAIKVLRQAKDQSLELKLALVQLLLHQGSTDQAIAVLTNMGQDSFRLGIVSLVVSLYLSLNDRKSAVELLKKAIAWHKEHPDQSSQQSLVTLYREASRLLIQSPDPESGAREAAALLEQQRILTPDNPRVIAQLIAAYSHFDDSKAQAMRDRLPPIDSVMQSVDVDALEDVNWSLGAKYVRKAAKGQQDESGVKSQEKKKKKRKRKVFRGKNYDPNVDPDPERWLPKWQRTQYKRKKDKRKETGIGKGSQGVVSDAVPESKPSPKAGHSAPQSPPGPRQQSWQKKKKGKR